MLRVISQEIANERAWDSYLQGAGKKGESFEKYARRVGSEARTRPSAEVSEAERLLTIRRVKQSLGRFYRPPLKA